MNSNWLPKGKKAAVCFSVDDVHPQNSSLFFDGGGDLEKGSLGKLMWLTQRHPQLCITLFTTADWRTIDYRPTRKVAASLPWLNERLYLGRRFPKGTMRLDRHPRFVDFLNGNDHFEVAFHGLHHCHRGPLIPIEFQEQTEAEFYEIIGEMRDIFHRSGVHYVNGLCPPGWNAPPALLTTLQRFGFDFVASSRDLFTPVAPGATAAMSGMRGVPLFAPTALPKHGLIHIPCNFQATSSIDRALDIIRQGGLLSIKAHIIEGISLDAVGLLYMNYLDVLFRTLEERFGDAIWWTTMGEIAQTMLKKSNDEHSTPSPGEKCLHRPR